MPEAGATLSFWVNRETEINWDFVFVEAHTAGQNDWTTLPDTNGHTGTSTGASCPYWLDLHPFLLHYQTDVGQGRCRRPGSTGVWYAASGAATAGSSGPSTSAGFAGTTAEVAISYASDDSYQVPGVAVDDIEVSTGEGSTSFEADGDELDGWAVTGAPAGQHRQRQRLDRRHHGRRPTAWAWGRRARSTASPRSSASCPAGSAPTRSPTAAAIVDDVGGVGFALENQTRPIYPPEFFGDPVEGESMVVHELAHQWYGDRVSVRLWQAHLAERGLRHLRGVAVERAGGHGTPQQIFDFYYAIPAASPFWDLEIGDPGPGRSLRRARSTSGGP